MVRIHPNFRLWCLANRPGYPFHGNSVFASGLHTCLRPHWVGAPDEASLAALAAAYAPGAHAVGTLDPVGQ